MMGLLCERDRPDPLPHPALHPSTSPFTSPPACPPARPPACSFKYPGRDDFGMKNMNIGIDMGSRVAIVGPNGAGKSTLMNLLAGDLVPTQGEQRRSHKLRVGRYAQHFVDALRMDETPVDYLLSRYPESGACVCCVRVVGVECGAYVRGVRWGAGGVFQRRALCRGHHVPLRTRV